MTVSKEVRELVASSGNVRLAAERLQISPSDLLNQVLDNDIEDLNKSIKTSIVLQLLDVLSNYRVALVASLDEADPRTLSKSFSELLGTLQTLLNETHSDHGKSAVNLMQVFDNNAGSARESLLSGINRIAEPVESES